MAIPKASDEAHVRANVAALQVQLERADLNALDAVFSPPAKKRPLALL